MTKITIDMIFGTIVLAAVIWLSIVEHYRKKAFKKLEKRSNLPEFLENK